MLLGCIGDDFTGSSDLANTLAKQGMRVTQYSGIPHDSAGADVEAGIIALKSRSIPVDEAVSQSLAALDWLKAQGCKQFFFKYCSTFDSTPTGNIGPVADALAQELDARCIIVCPAFPGTGRSVYQGHLFVNDTLLNESGMQDHPLNPMTDADIRRWLARQTDTVVEHVPAAVVFKGAGAIRDALRLADQRRRFVVVDAIRDEDLLAIGAAAEGLALVTGGSGVAVGLPNNFREIGDIGGTAASWQGQTGRCVALSGSCSQATRRQVAVHAHEHPTLALDPAAILHGVQTVDDVVAWFAGCEGIPLVYSSADPETVAELQHRHGQHNIAVGLETFFANLARRLLDVGVHRLISAGGETSGAIVEGLGIKAFEIGPEIDPGVPALRAGPQLTIALKSGNFGSDDFFTKAAACLLHGSDHD